MVVPAGTFEAFKIELIPSAGTPHIATIWIAKDTMRPVKMVSIISAVGGAAMTAEMQ